MAQPNSPLAATAYEHQLAATPAEKGIRVAGYLIDVVPAIVLGLFVMFPVLGPIIAGLLLSPYWLLRDISGASIGKLILGYKVVLKGGQPASVGARILRNLPLAVGPAFLIIPFLGYLLGPAVSCIAVLVEGILVLTGGERLGDKIAGTTVIKK
jgi:uncharacterized RDD family membrane protein YckC